MPGHIGTSIIINSSKVLGKPDALNLPPAEVAEVRERLVARGMPVKDMSDDQIRNLVHQFTLSFRDNAPVSAAQAATIILDGVRRGAWRILVGDDAHAIDRMIRESPETAYEKSFTESLHRQGFLPLSD